MTFFKYTGGGLDISSSGLQTVPHGKRSPETPREEKKGQKIPGSCEMRADLKRMNHTWGQEQLPQDRDVWRKLAGGGVAGIKSKSNLS